MSCVAGCGAVLCAANDVRPVEHPACVKASVGRGLTCTEYESLCRGAFTEDAFGRLDEPPGDEGFV